MTQRLQPSDSAEKCINSSNRHTRLCNQVQGTEFLVVSIKPAVDECTAKQIVVSEAVKLMEGAYDIWVFTDGILDAAVKNAANRCKEFDRENPGANIFATIFPDGTEVITKEKRDDEPDKVDKLAVRFEALGAAHLLFPYAAKLRETAQKSRDMCTTYKNLTKKVDLLKTELDIAKSVLISKYIVNMLDAEKTFGREYANRLFPILRNSDSSAKDTKDTKDSGQDIGNGVTTNAEQLIAAS